MAGRILTDAERVDLMLPGLLFRRIIAGLIREFERDGQAPDEHPLMPALRMFDYAAAEALSGLVVKKQQKLTERGWRVSGRAVKPLEERPLATAIVAVTTLVRECLDDGTLTVDPDGPFMKAFDVLVDVSGRDGRDRQTLETVQRSAEKAGRAILELLRKEGALRAPTIQ